MKKRIHPYFEPRLTCRTDGATYLNGIPAMGFFCGLKTTNTDPQAKCQGARDPADGAVGKHRFAKMWSGASPRTYISILKYFNAIDGVGRRGPIRKRVDASGLRPSGWAVWTTFTMSDADPFSNTIGSQRGAPGRAPQRDTQQEDWASPSVLSKFKRKWTLFTSSL